MAPLSPPRSRHRAPETITAKQRLGRRAALDRSLATGTAWAASLKIVSQTATWLSTLGVARLLDPTDYGIFGMATLYLGLLQMVSEFGIGAAIVVLPEVDRDDAAQLNTVAVGVGTVGAALLCATAPLAAWFFRSPRLTPVLIVLSASFVISSFRTVPLALLQRGLRYKRLAVYDALQAVVLAGCSLTLALLGARYWTLVVAALLSTSISAALTISQHPTGFARPRRARVAGALSLGGEIVAQRVAWYGYSNADFLVAGRVLGAHAVGAYTLAWTLANVAIDKIGSTVLQVTPGVLSRARDDVAELRRYVVRITEILMLVLSPVTVGLALVAPEFVAVTLGPKWAAVVPALRILSLYATARALMPLFSQVLVAQGAQRVATRINLLLVLVMPPAFWIGSHWGITGIALAWVIVYPVIAWQLVRRTLAGVHLGGRTFVRQAVWPAASSCAVMAIAVTATRLVMPAAWPSVGRLAIEVAVGASTYLAALAGLHGTRTGVLVGRIRALRASEPTVT